jgi:putative hydrolase of the HAD superfamily
MHESTPKAILLDALGTLLALEPPAPLLRAELARRFTIDVTEEQAARAIAAEITYYRAHLDEGRDNTTLEGLRRRCGAVLRDALPEPVALLDIDDITTALLASLRFRAFPDVGPALAALKQRRHRLVVVSNWDVSLHAVLERLSIAPLLDGIITSAQAGARKPDPAIFDRALRVAGVAPDHAIHVGDSLEEDVAGARRSGIEPVLIRRDGTITSADVRTIASLADLVGGRPPLPPL